MDDLLKDAHEEEKEVRNAKVKTKERQSVMNTDVPTHGRWAVNSKDENDLTFLSINVNSSPTGLEKATRQSASNTHSKSTALTRQGCRKCA